MSAITLQEAKEMLALWMKASADVATGQSFKIGAQEYTRADAKELLRMITYWRTEVDRLSRGGMRVMRAIPRDL